MSSPLAPTWIFSIGVITTGTGPMANTIGVKGNTATLTWVLTLTPALATRLSDPFCRMPSPARTCSTLTNGGSHLGPTRTWKSNDTPNPRKPCALMLSPRLASIFTKKG